MTNVSALPKNDIVSDADLARAAAPAIAANEALRAAGKPELAMVEVAGAEGDFPLGVTGKSLKPRCLARCVLHEHERFQLERNCFPRPATLR